MPMLLSGTSCVLVDTRGDIDAETDPRQGALFADRRVLSRLVLTIDGHRPRLLDHVTDTHREQRFAGWSGAHHGVLVDRSLQLTDDGLLTTLTLTSWVPGSPVTVHLQHQHDELDLFSIKHQVFGMDGINHAPNADAHHHEDPTPSHERVSMEWTHPPDQITDHGSTWTIDLDRGTPWVLHGLLRVDSHAMSHQLSPVDPLPARMTTGDPALRTSWNTAIDDLNALEIVTPHGRVPAAGAPWFLAVFGRDSLITALQTIAVSPHRAAATLRYLVAHQAHARADNIDAEPGKILHEVRSSALGQQWHETYYGSVDATPLMIMLASEYWRWTHDHDLITELRPGIELALSWVETRLLRDGLLFYQRRADPGLDNQSWKDSWNSQCTSEGVLLTSPIAALEAQAYAVAALRGAATLFRVLWSDADRSQQLSDRADSLMRSIAQRFLLPDARGDFLALAIDGSGTVGDSLTSNIGHVLWSSVFPDDHPITQASAAMLASPLLASGWGIRTMSTRDASWDPFSYHCGSVWPHDTSIAVAGLARSGHRAQAEQLAHSLLGAAGTGGGRLPEVMSGQQRVQGAERPLPYPTTCSPQAWASGAVIQSVCEVLDLRPDPERQQLTATADTVAEWLDGARIEGLTAFGIRWNLDVHDRRVRITQAATHGEH